MQKTIVGAEVIDGMYASAAPDELHFQHYLSANCFGDHLTRMGIDVATRELLTFAMLVSLGGCDPQAKGHVSANLNVGNDRATLISVITHLLPCIGYPRTPGRAGETAGVVVRAGLRRNRRSFQPLSSSTSPSSRLGTSCLPATTTGTSSSSGSP